MFFHDLETERLILKNISKDDREFIFRQFSDPDVSRYLFDEEPFKEINEADWLLDFYMENEPRNQHRWIITLKEDGTKVGTCGFHCWDREGESCEVGYDLYPDYWNKGYVSEALTSILEFAKDDMKVKRVDAVIYKDHVRSQNAAIKHGFKYSGRDKIYDFRGEKYLHYIYSLAY